MWISLYALIIIIIIQSSLDSAFIYVHYTKKICHAYFTFPVLVVLFSFLLFTCHIAFSSSSSSSKLY